MATRFCTNCGQPIEGDGRFCTSCGAPMPQAETTTPPHEPQMAYGQQNSYETPQQPQYEAPRSQPSRPQPTGPKPKNYLVLAILSTILCCLPFGIVSIVYAAKVDNYWNAGNYLQAEAASRKAKGWMLAAVITCLLITILYIVLIAVGVSAYGTDWLEELR